MSPINFPRNGTTFCDLRNAERSKHENQYGTIRFIITLFEKERRPRLESKARELGIASSVRFTGAVSPEELAVCYHRCSVFAMPARTELDAREPRGEGRMGEAARKFVAREFSFERFCKRLREGLQE